jgi:3-oxoacyl-[acyl-carrier protein] reductase
VFVTGSVDESDPDHDALDRQMTINVHGANNMVRAGGAAAARRRPDRFGRDVRRGRDQRPPPGARRLFRHEGSDRRIHERLGSRPRPTEHHREHCGAGADDTEMNPADGESAAVMAAATALGRHGTPEDIAAAVAFLVGPDATYVTGSALTVDGGRAA